MKDKRVSLALSILVLAALACGLPGTRQATQAPPPTVTPYVPPAEKTTAPPEEPTEEPTLPPPPPESPTPEAGATSPPPPPAPTATPVVESAGPLDFPEPGWGDLTYQPLPDGHFEARLSIHISGGAPPFTVRHDIDVFQTSQRDYDIVFRAIGCSALVHTITVESADGQIASHDYFIPAPWCQEDD
jgi:hypothetical protein